MSWWDMKVWLAEWTGLHMDALHVHAGMIGLLLAALVLRRSLASPWPWLMLLAAELANEYYDLAKETWPDRAYQYDESFRDLWNTMLIPTLLLVAARFAPRLLVGRGASPVAAPTRQEFDAD